MGEELFHFVIPLPLVRFAVNVPCILAGHPYVEKVMLQVPEARPLFALPFTFTVNAEVWYPAGIAGLELVAVPWPVTEMTVSVTVTTPPSNGEWVVSP